VVFATLREARADLLSATATTTAAGPQLVFVSSGVRHVEGV